MADFEEFSVGLADSDAAEPLMQIPSELPALPLRDIVIYPFMIVPLFVSRDKSIKAVEEALKGNRMIVLVSQKDLNKEDPGSDDLFEVGTVAIIMRMLKLPDGRIRILIQGLSRATIDGVDPAGDHVTAKITPVSEPLAPENSLEVEALVRNVRGSMERAASLGKNISPEVLAIIANLEDAGRLADLCASNLDLKVEDAQSVLDGRTSIDPNANSSCGSSSRPFSRNLVRATNFSKRSRRIGTRSCAVKCLREPKRRLSGNSKNSSGCTPIPLKPPLCETGWT